jgi:predicted Rossmann fold nucleotide-binding protein DprA/Smf involved in DNA uptake
VLSDRSAGTNRLVRDGATPLLETADLTAVPALADALDRTRGRARLALPYPAFHPRASSKRSDLPPHLSTLLARIGQDPVHPDRLAAALDLSPTVLAAQLADLELAGHVRTLPGGLVARDAAADSAAHTAPAVPTRAGG